MRKSEKQCFRMRVLSHEIRTAFEPYHEIVKDLFSSKNTVRFYNTDTHSLTPSLTSFCKCEQCSFFVALNFRRLGWAARMLARRPGGCTGSRKFRSGKCFGDICTFS